MEQRSWRFNVQCAGSKVKVKSLYLYSVCGLTANAEMTPPSQGRSRMETPSSGRYSSQESHYSQRKESLMRHLETKHEVALAETEVVKKKVGCTEFETNPLRTTRKQT